MRIYNWCWLWYSVRERTTNKGCCTGRLAYPCGRRSHFPLRRNDKKQRLDHGWWSLAHYYQQFCTLSLGVCLADSRVGCEAQSRWSDILVIVCCQRRTCPPNEFDVILFFSCCNLYVSTNSSILEPILPQLRVISEWYGTDKSNLLTDIFKVNFWQLLLSQDRSCVLTFCENNDAPISIIFPFGISV